MIAIVPCKQQQDHKPETLRPQTSSLESMNSEGSGVTVHVLTSPTAVDSRRRQVAFPRGASASPSLSDKSPGTPASRRPGDPPPDNSFATLLRRHRFLLVTMAVLLVLCVIYLYFAVSMTGR